MTTTKDVREQIVMVLAQDKEFFEDEPPGTERDAHMANAKADLALWAIARILKILDERDADNGGATHE